jgi:hypothetical protein
MSYNTGFQVTKSTQLIGLDCQTTGILKRVGFHAGTTLDFVSDVTLTSAVEAGECIAMIRVPAGFKVTEGQLSWTANTDAIIGVGDPFCCGRLLGPILTSLGSGLTGVAPQGTACAYTGIISKVGRTADGCGLGYTYTCETDVIVTNGYGENSFGIGGGKTGSANGGGSSGPLAAGTVLYLRLKGIQT